MKNLRDKPQHVKNHPLIRETERCLSESRKIFEKYAQMVADDESLVDMFSDAKKEEQQWSTKAKTLPEITYEAIRVAERTLDQFDWPLRPDLSYNNAINIKNATTDASVVSGEIVLNCLFRNISGQRKHATLYMPIHRGNVLPPSTIEFDGKREILAQSVLDEMLDRITAYDLEPLRGMYDPPFDSREEREAAVEARNEIGWQPKDPPYKYLLQKNSAKMPSGWEAIIEVMEDAEENGLDTFPRPFQHLETHYLIPLLGYASKDEWHPHLVNTGFCINEYGMNRGRGKSAQMEKEVDLEVMEELPEEDLMEPMLEKGPRFYNNTKMPIELNDGIKFRGGDNNIRGQIVEINPDEDFIIVKAKGLEYRVNVEDIEPLPNTFKKMWS